MTLVHIDLRGPAPGGTTPVTGHVDWKLTRFLEGSGFVVLPGSFSTPPLVDGKVSVEVLSADDPSFPPGAVWDVWERTKSGRHFYVIVPNVTSIQYSDLVRVDPKTLNPVPAPENYWAAQLSTAADAAAAAAVSAAAAQAAAEGAGTLSVIGRNPDGSFYYDAAGVPGGGTVTKDVDGSFIVTGV